MASFKNKKLQPPKRVCLRLKEARENCGISLELLSQKTKISKDQLQALEECRFKELPEGEIYQKNFIRRYVEALGLDSASFLRQYVFEESIKKKKNIHPCQEIKKNYLQNLPTFLRYGFVIIILLSLFFYLGLQIKNIVEPPKLIIYSPLEGYISDQLSIAVQGETNKEVRVSLNGKEISTSEDGMFEEIVDLSEGVNVLVIEAKKKHGKTTREERHVILKTAEEGS
ncbi:MAG: helix-turn-helix domain-containing protein [Candidatus Magasanikbacteria bacterium]